jgi:hypothetical protein
MIIPQVITKIQCSFDQPIRGNVSHPFFAISPPVPQLGMPSVFAPVQTALLAGGFNPVDAETVRRSRFHLCSLQQSRA